MDFERFKDKIVFLFAFLALSIFLLLLDSIGAFNKLFDFASFVSTPVRIELHTYSLKVNTFFNVLGRISSLSNENSDLKKENQSLLEERTTCQEASIKNDLLKQQLGLKSITQTPVLEARVIGSNIGFENSLQINVGSADGAEIGDIVVFNMYAIGKVKTIDEHSAKILLITSPSSNIPVRGIKNRARGFVRGEVGLTLQMKEILPNEKIEEGETIVTSGIENEFPPDLIIGIVTKVSNIAANTRQEAEVQVQIDFKQLDYVYVIKGQKL
jgi:rod shape-determining protein MreC